MCVFPLLLQLLHLVQQSAPLLPVALALSEQQQHQQLHIFAIKLT
jgi:hypothetical protein